MDVNGSLHAQLVDALGQRIGRGELAEGDVVSRERLEVDYDVSRSVVREALRTLEELGMVRSRHKVGTLVQPRTAWALLNPRVIGWRADGPDADVQLGELLTLREAVEPVAARLAAQKSAEHAGPALADELREHLRAMRSAYAGRSRPGFVAADTAFHRTMLESSANAVLSQLVQTLVATLHARYSDRRQLFTTDTGASLDRHERVIQAIADLDPVAAEASAALLVQATRVEVLGSQAGEH